MEGRGDNKDNKEKGKGEGGGKNPSLVKGFQGLPNSISSILFGAGASESEQKKQQPKSTLSKMSDGTIYLALYFQHLFTTLR